MADVIIRPSKALSGEVSAPPSKAYTQRMLIAAALSAGSSVLSCPLTSSDTEATLRAVTGLGMRVKIRDECWRVQGATPLEGAAAPIDCGESGATLRFMIPVAALAREPSVFVFGSSLEQRPIQPLLESLSELGAKAELQRLRGKPCVRVEGGGIAGGKTKLPGDVSSQFISGLMFACPLAKADTEIALTTPLESKGYVQMTAEVLAKHGINVSISEDFSHVKIPANQAYKPCNHRVLGDFSSAAFLLAAAAIVDSHVKVTNLDYRTLQGDKVVVRILKEMGANGKVCPKSIEINGKRGSLNAVDMDAKDTPDLVPICAVLACYAKGTSRNFRLDACHSTPFGRIMVLSKGAGKGDRVPGCEKDD